jgi:hypothetical protein
VLPPGPAPAALIGIWPCGAPGFKAAQAYEAAVTGAPPLHRPAIASSPGLYFGRAGGLPTRPCPAALGS